jgi:hypothetical protein
MLGVPGRWHRHWYQSRSNDEDCKTRRAKQEIEPTPSELLMEYLCVEEGIPSFANSVAKKVARL